MDDLAICKRIAEIEGVEVYETTRPTLYIMGEEHIKGEPVLYIKKPFDDGLTKMSDGSFMTGLYYPDNAPKEYNPLTDDALCFNLMVKYKVDVEFFVDCVSGYIGGSCKGESIDDSPNKAILLAIIEANNEN